MRCIVVTSAAMQCSGLYVVHYVHCFMCTRKQHPVTCSCSIMVSQQFMAVPMMNHTFLFFNRCCYRLEALDACAKQASTSSFGA